MPDLRVWSVEHKPCVQPTAVRASGTCNSINRAPVFVAAAQDGTYVKVDFDNVGVYDIIDRANDDLPDTGQATDSTCGTDPYGLGLRNCLYLLDALQVLRVYDYTDYDNTGTRVVAAGGKPIAMSYGQDTDQAIGSDDIQDTGYTVYPLTQRFLDPVLLAGKDVSPSVVSGSGGQAVFTLHLQSSAFQPLTSLTSPACRCTFTGGWRKARSERSTIRSITCYTTNPTRK